MRRRSHLISSHAPSPPPHPTPTSPKPTGRAGGPVDGPGWWRQGRDQAPVAEHAGLPGEKKREAARTSAPRVTGQAAPSLPPPRTHTHTHTHARTHTLPHTGHARRQDGRPGHRQGRGRRPARPGLARPGAVLAGDDGAARARGAAAARPAADGHAGGAGLRVRGDGSPRRRRPGTGGERRMGGGDAGGSGRGGRGPLPATYPRPTHTHTLNTHAKLNRPSTPS